MSRPALFVPLTLLVLSGCAKAPSEKPAAFDPNPAAGGSVAAASVPSLAGSPARGGKGVVFVSASYKQALEKARAEKKLLMVDLYADWCGWCHKLDDEVFSDARVAAALGGVIPIKLDADREGQDLAESFRVQGLPTILFLDGSGKLVKRIDGYLDADQMIDLAGELPKASA